MNIRGQSAIPVPTAPGVATGVRTFRIKLLPASARDGEGDRYGIALEEAYSDGMRTLTSQVASATPLQCARLLDALVHAVHSSGHPAGVLSAKRQKPVPLDEAAGVRLALTLLAARPISKPTRVRQIVGGIASMSTEETYYWYAKAVGPDGDRVRRALRLFLAEE